MSAKPRIVFNVNVLLSAFLFPASVPGQAVQRILTNGSVLSSVYLLAELHSVLNRDKFDRYLTPEERTRLLVSFTRDSELVAFSQSIHVCRDPTDDHLLELAVEGKADGVVTGDQDLLILHPFRNIPILTPADFLRLHASP